MEQEWEYHDAWSLVSDDEEDVDVYRIWIHPSSLEDDEKEQLTYIRATKEEKKKRAGTERESVRKTSHSLRRQSRRNCTGARKSDVSLSEVFLCCCNFVLVNYVSFVYHHTKHVPSERQLPGRLVVVVVVVVFDFVSANSEG